MTSSLPERARPERQTLAVDEALAWSPVVYRLYDARGQLLYVGKAVSLPSRCRAHKATQPWWPEVASVTTEPCADLAEAERLELIAIQQEHPKHNRAGRVRQLNLLPAGSGRARVVRMTPAATDTAVMEAFGRAVAIFRIRAGLTQAELGERSGVGWRTVGRIERGERDPMLSVVFWLAEALGVGPGVLIDGAARARQDPEPGQEG